MKAKVFTHFGVQVDILGGNIEKGTAHVREKYVGIPEMWEREDYPIIQLKSDNPKTEIYDKINSFSETN